jgi:hypothetical protein
MSTIISRSHVGLWEPSDFAWTVPTIVLLLLLEAYFARIESGGFPRVCRRASLAALIRF